MEFRKVAVAIMFEVNEELKEETGHIVTNKSLKYEIRKEVKEELHIILSEKPDKIVNIRIFN